MTDPLEIMMKAIWPDLYDDPSKGAFERAAAYTVEAARARAEGEKRLRLALLALAEAELPEEVLEDGADAHHQAVADEKHRIISRYRELGGGVPDKVLATAMVPKVWMRPCFSALLRSIANGKTE